MYSTSMITELLTEPTTSAVEQLCLHASIEQAITTATSEERSSFTLIKKWQPERAEEIDLWWANRVTARLERYEQLRAQVATWTEKNDARLLAKKIDQWTQDNPFVATTPNPTWS